ncbi:MAG: UdgX family uracil-DNA binding protein [Chitinophagaceae bacterium]|nr:UdgX family uracil-DNA binding protein [Rubrivivax sp.]
MQCVVLAGEVDVDGFRAAARRLLQQAVDPDAVEWTVAGSASPSLLASAAPPPAQGSDTQQAVDPNRDGPRVPAEFIAMCNDVLQHADPGRFQRLYRLLWRLQREPALRHDALDPGLAKARQMAQTVRREQHKMKAFVRFREVAEPGATADDPPLHVAWFEPAHHVVEAVAPFFMRRFAGMRFAILTPERCVHWDGRALTLAAGADRNQAPPADAGEALWLTYYASIFNPARLKLRAMEKEMPRRYWTNLPEARLIGGLAASAHERSARMVEREAQPTARRLPAVRLATSGPGHGDTVLAAHLGHGNADTDTDIDPGGADLQATRDAVNACRECPLGALATQAVFGEGPPGAALMLVGEQPGDQEDLQGRPFVGPAGQLMARAMAQLGWPREAVYITNAVKHFKYEPRGKRRIHKSPAQREADACLHWLESEIAMVAPQAIVALGATAARQLLGRPVAMMRERGQWLARADGVPVLVTLHPSALLRMNAEERDAAYAAWLADLGLASRYGAAPHGGGQVS